MKKPKPQHTAARIARAVIAMSAMLASAKADTLKLTTNDASGKSSFDKWDASAATPGNAPSAENDYVIDGNRRIRVIYNRTFGGNTITFGVGAQTEDQGGLVVSRGDSLADHSIGFGNNGAILQNGYFTPWENNRTPKITAAGPITVTAPESNPFRIAAAEVTSSSINTNNKWTIQAPIKGSSGTALMLSAGGKRNNAVLAPAAADTFTITGSMSEFFGKLIISGGLAGSAREAVPVNVVFDTVTMGGTTVVQKGAQIKARYTDRTYTTAGLELQAGSILLANNKRDTDACGKIVVTESLNVEKGAVIKLVNHPYAGNHYEERKWVVLTLPAEKGTIPLDKIEFPDLNDFPPCEVRTNLVDGVWQLEIHKDAHDVLKTNDDSGTTISKALPSALTNAASWVVGGKAPEKGRMYVASKGAGGLTAYPIIRTPYYNDTSTRFTFAGSCLALDSGSTILPCTRDVTFPFLYLSSNVTYPLSLASVPSYLRGRIYLRASSDSYPQRFQAYMKGLNTVAAEVSGAGTLFVTGRSGSGNPYGDVEFTALNTNYTGRIKVCAEVNNVTAGADDYKHERVFITDARNLGGPLDAFKADALELADYSVLEARKDVDMNVANRGITVTGNAAFAAPENVTLAISNDITWNGAVRKTGDGTLALNGAARVASGATATLAVEKGCLRVGSTNALSGVSVTFADGAALLVDPAATGDVATLGAVDLSDAPFGGTLPVAFVLPADGKPNYIDLAVCTVKDAATAKELTIAPARVAGCNVAFTTRANADGTVTVLASVTVSGLMLIVW